MLAQTKKSTTYVKDGTTHQKPVRKTRHEQHGFPYPSHLTKVDSVLLDEARGKAMNCKGVMIKYLRAYEISKIFGENGRITGNRVVKGIPWAALVAFKGEDGRLIVGWSKRHPGKAYKIDGRIIPVKDSKAVVFANDRTVDELADVMVNIEQLMFTKKDAIAVAILRAMTDGLVFSHSKKHSQKTIRSADGSFIPKCVEKAIPRFIQRAESYFRAPVTNTRTRSAGAK